MNKAAARILSAVIIILYVLIAALLTVLAKQIRRNRGNMPVTDEFVIVIPEICGTDETPAGTAYAPAVSPIPTPASAPTPAPVSAPTPTRVPEPTSAPVPELTPTPVPEQFSITFTESKELHLPDLSEELWYGQRFNLSGTVSSEYPLEKVTVQITSENGADPLCPYTASVVFPNDEVFEYALEDSQSTAEKQSINDIVSVKFKEFSPGPHTFKLIARSTKVKITLKVSKFKIVKPEDGWLRLISNNFRNNYSTALKFFGSREKFMFKYKWENNDSGRNIITDPAWVKKYITSVKGINGKWWTVHKDAVPYCQKAVDYMENTHIRVRSENHDSGVIKLSSLMKSFNGSYVSRFVTDRTFISHHAFGTAIDINAGTKPYNNTTANWKVIKAEARKLVYNGILEEDGKKYYDFTYNGEWKQYYNGVPESVLNFLLYELAFYRAGFAWGYYYPHTCDGMHFTLTDLDKALHEAPGTGLRKVFEYCN